MRVRLHSIGARLIGLAALACLAACTAPTDPNDQKPVRQAFEDFKSALVTKHAQQALDGLDQPSRDYLQSAVTKPPDFTGADEEVRELVRQVVTKLTPGGIQPGFKLATPLQRVLDAGWINAHALDGLDLGPVSIQGDSARAEILWQGQGTMLHLIFVRESGVWKIDISPLAPYAETALQSDRMVKGETEAQQIAQLVARVPAP
jgi:hypothetical protein